MGKKGKIPEIILAGAALIAFFVLWGTGAAEFNQAFVIIYTIYTFIRYINNLGYTINIFDFLTFYSALDSLLSPLISYQVFNKSDPLVKAWGAYMRVPEDVYFAYLIPANLALFAGLHMVFYKKVQSAEAYLVRVREYVADKSKIGFAFVGVGVVAGQFVNSAPGSLAFIFYLLGMLSYVGGFYLYFSIRKRRNLIMLTVFGVFFVQAIQEGLFGEFAMFMVLAGSLIVAQYRFSFFSKLMFFVVAFAGVIIIQSVKSEYRLITWNGRGTQHYENQGNLEIFSDLISDKISSPSRIFNNKDLFFLNRRLNQGLLISMAMNYVPRVEPYADGETIWLSLAAVAVPRFLWPDKPEAGGRLNLARFLGIKRHMAYSMNIGPYGEGYGNFGPVGGVIFIFAYSLLIAFFLHKTLEKSWKYPSLVIWIPLLFYYVLTVETDILTTVNSFVKTIVFILVIYWAAKRFFHVEV